MIFSFTNDISKCGVLGLSLTSCRVVSQRRCLPDKRHDLSRNPVIVRAQNNEQLVKTYIRADVGISPCAILWSTKPLTFDSDFLKIRWPLHFVLPVCASVFFRKCRRFFHSMPSKASKNTNAPGFIWCPIANRVHGSSTPALLPSSFEKYHCPASTVVALPIAIR